MVGPLQINAVCIGYKKNCVINEIKTYHFECLNFMQNTCFSSKNTLWRIKQDLFGETHLHNTIGGRVFMCQSYEA